MSHKLWVAVIAIIVMLIAVVGFAGYRSSQSQAHADDVGRELAQRVEMALHWQGLTDANAARTQAMIISSDSQVGAEFKDAISATSAQISKIQKALETLAQTDADKAQMAKIAEARAAMLGLRKQANELRDAYRADDAAVLIQQQYNPAVRAYLAALSDFVTLQQDYARQQQVLLGADRLRTVQIAGVLVALVLVFIVVGAFFLIRSIQQPLAQASGMADRIARGDLTQRTTRAGQLQRGDEFGVLMQSLEGMRASLARMVQDVRHSSDSIAVASSQIASGNQDLSSRTEATSSNLQQTAAAMEEFTSTIQQSSGSASQASQLAASASEVAQRGGAVVAQVVSTMEDIQDSSRKIADINSVIDGIAFQTNILALNAAVEAARAGEQGRGFAVVAGEVRQLAQRSAEAARQIKDLIGASVERVDSGSRLVQGAGQTMQEVVQSVQRVADMMGEITAAAAEQSAGVTQVNQAVGQLDQMTQQNAALVEESAAAAQSLREQAAQLSTVVSAFRVDGMAPLAQQGGRGGAGAAAALAPAAAAPLPAGGGQPAAIQTPPARRAVPAKPAAPARPAAAPARPAPKPLAVAAMADDEGEWESF
ncbi:hypothetical protein GCM10022279_22790 [Comamonas faecalis]|uniref:HAMP domain-containing protein n=2 Tax=Comamonas faecalis TaxID=1387849 RepID=A0ABP7RJL3_9BURK